MWYFTSAANNRSLRKNTTFSFSTFSKRILKFFYHCVYTSSKNNHTYALTLNANICYIYIKHI